MLNVAELGRSRVNHVKKLICIRNKHHYFMALVHAFHLRQDWIFLQCNVRTSAWLVGYYCFILLCKSCRNRPHCSRCNFETILFILLKVKTWYKTQVWIRIFKENTGCPSKSASFMNLLLFLLVYHLPDNILYHTIYSSYNALCRIEDVYIIYFFPVVWMCLQRNPLESPRSGLWSCWIFWFQSFIGFNNS